MQPALEELKVVLSELGNVARVSPVSGGSISQAFHVTLRTLSGESREVFVKRNKHDFLNNFRCEVRGLEKLAEFDAIRVPQTHKVREHCGSAWLVMEWIESADPSRLKDAQGSSRFFEHLGGQLAELHRQSACERIGLEYDNYLGAARQINSPESEWIDFVRKHRLGFQLRWAVEQNLAHGKLRDDVNRIMERLPELLAGRETTSSILHGDLWSGNYLCDVYGQPVIFDPAIYFGCREAEFGMLKLFGNCPLQFYATYQAHFPLPTGWERRAEIYQLVHLLNHLNLFGASYNTACSTLAQRILSQ